MTFLPLILALAGMAMAKPMPQGVTAAITPSGTAPAGCLPSYAGTFGIIVMNGTGTGATPTQSPDGQLAVSQISDGQIQAPTAPTAVVTGVSQLSDGQIQAPTAPTAVVTGVSQLSDGQIQAPTATSHAPTAASQAPDGQLQSSGNTSSTHMVACLSADSVQLTLKNGILLDSKGRTGYIASNYQFQFDAPAQAGAIYTAGWSVCANGNLALGGSEVFYRCRSGSFYNLYNTDWAPQCEAASIKVVQLVTC